MLNGLLETDEDERERFANIRLSAACNHRPPESVVVRPQYLVLFPSKWEIQSQ
jgi:hypothetical protein